MTTAEEILGNVSKTPAREDAEKVELLPEEYEDRKITTTYSIQMYVVDLRTAGHQSYDELPEFDFENGISKENVQRDLMVECSRPFREWFESADGEKVLDAFVRNHTVAQIEAREDFDSLIEAFKPHLLRNQLLKYIANEIMMSEEEFSTEDKDARVEQLAEANRNLFTDWSQSQEASALLDTYTREHTITDIMGPYDTRKPVDFERLVEHFHAHVPDEQILH